MSERDLVEFVEPASRELAPADQDALKPELEAIFTADDKRKARAITVSRCFTGYSSDVRRSVVLGVGVRFEDGFESHIVKIGRRDKVEPDWTGWRDCTAGRDVASRILHPPRLYSLSEDRVAVLYRDAYMLFGGYGTKTRVESLETVVEWAVNDDSPSPLSVERVIAQIYTDMDRWLYYGARVEDDQKGALAFYRAKLHEHRKEEDRVLVRWGRPASPPRPDLVGLRRDAIWLLCGKERPEKLDATFAPYLDPVDYVRWAIDTAALPRTLVGRAHGDLHARNVLLGVERGEAEYPAVFDYGEMAPDNVLAWDFAKLETELKVRLLPRLYRDREAREHLLKSSPRQRKPEAADADDVSDQARRADRLEFAFLLEKLLGERTERIQGRDDAERLTPPGGREVTRVRKLDRLLGVLLRIRQEAALALGFNRGPGRQFDWRDEYYFALAVYGLMNVKWDYEPRAIECALISAGVAAARISTTQAMTEPMKRDAVELARCPSYRVPLWLAHRCWQAGKAEEGLALLNRYEAMRGHAIPLEQERALLLSEVGQGREAQKLVQRFREGCKVFGDHETLSRLGRTYKNAGDQAWQKQYVPGSSLAALTRHSPAWQQYEMALKVYEEAFELSNDHYPGVNAASLALLLGETYPGKAKELADRVAKLCRDPGIFARDDPFWIYATEGEAALVLGDYAEAYKFYDNALDEPSAELQYVEAAYHQLCRLWHVRDQGQMARLIDEVFARHPTWASIRPGPVGGCGERK